MYQTMKSFLLLPVLTFLKITVILVNSFHFSFFCICKVILEFFKLPSTFLFTDLHSISDSDIRSFSHCSSPKVSTFVQTEELSQYEIVGGKATTDVVIYNLNSSQKLVITQGKFKRNPCENCKSAAEISSLEKVEDLTVPSVSVEGSNISYMSIESDVLDSKIENGYSSLSTSSEEKKSLKAFDVELNRTPVDVENSGDETSNTDNDNCIASMKIENFINMGSNDRAGSFSASEEFDNFECLKGNKSNETYIKRNDTALHTQKTSSPLHKLSQNVQTPSTNYNNRRFQMTDSKISTIFDSWKKDTSVKDLKRRLSLPVKLNTTETAVINFKLTQQKLIEAALKITPRHERSFKDIKYPYSSEISLESRHNEGEDKEVFSCSSYESLPVSDHIRNAFEKNTLLNLYNENLDSNDKPDFSCVDGLIDAFNDIKSYLSVSNLAQSKITQTALPNVVRKKKKFESSSERGQLKPSSCDEKSIDDRMLFECQEVIDSSKGSRLDFETGERTVSNLNFEMNLGINISDVCTKLMGYEEANETIENKQNQKSTSSPRRTTFSEACEQTSDFENTVLCLEDEVEGNKSDSNDNFPKIWQESFHNITIIDESNSPETNCKNQNIPKTNSLNKDEKPMLILESTSIGAGVELEKSNYSNLNPVWSQSYIPFRESTKTDKNKQSEQTILDLVGRTGKSENDVINLKDKVKTKKPDYLSLVFLRDKKAFFDKNDANETYRINQNFSESNCHDNSFNEDLKHKFPEKIILSDSIKSNESNNNLSAGQQSSHETAVTYQSISPEEICARRNIYKRKVQQCHSLEIDRKYRLYKKILSSAALKTNSNDEELLCRQLSNEVKNKYSILSSLHKKNRTQQNISMAKCNEQNSLNEYEKPSPVKETISSGDSASDNSEVTIKDLSVLG